MLGERELVHRDSLELEGLGFTNPRGYYDKGEIVDLSKSIKTKGIKDNLLVWRGEDGTGPRSIVLDGKRRIYAIDYLIENGESEGIESKIPIVPFTGTLAEAKIAALLAEFHHKNFNSFDRSKEIYDLIENHGYTQAQLADELGCSQPAISMAYSTFRDASKTLLKAWAKSDVPLDIIKEVSKLSEEEQAEAIKAVVKLRSNGRGGAGKARAAAKGENQRLPKKYLNELKVLAEDAKDPYVKGLLHAWEIDLGIRGIGELEDSWKKHLSKVSERKRDERIEERGIRSGDPSIDVED